MKLKMRWQYMLLTALVTFLGALFGLAGASAHAEPTAPDGGQRPASGNPMRVDDLLAAMHLTAQQTSSTQNTLDTERTAMRALEESVRAQRESIHAATRKKLAATLTPEQLTRFDAWRRDNRRPPPQGAMGAMGGARPQRPSEGSPRPPAQ